MSRRRETKARRASGWKRTLMMWIGICAGLIVLVVIIVLLFLGILSQTLATVLLGTLALGVAFWRSFIAHKQAVTAEKGQVTERFSQAIEQLGNKETAVCLGGIYALEKIAQQEPEDYHWTVMEVLCSFVREKSRDRPKSKDLPEDITEEERLRLSRLPAEIQAILTVLGRRHNTDAETEDQHLDLREANLSVMAELRRAKLKGVYLHETDFQLSVFSWADLRGAICFNANFTAANFGEADLSEAQLGNADLRGAGFAGTDLRSADLGGAKVHGADLRGAKNLTQDQVDSAYGNEHTRLPDEIKRPDHWVKPQESEEP